MPFRLALRSPAFSMYKLTLFLKEFQSTESVVSGATMMHVSFSYATCHQARCALIVRYEYAILCILVGRLGVSSRFRQGVKVASILEVTVQNPKGQDVPTISCGHDCFVSQFWGSCRLMVSSLGRLLEVHRLKAMRQHSFS